MPAAALNWEGMRWTRQGRLGARRLYAHGVRAGGGVVAATARRWREKGREGGWRRKSSSGGRVRVKLATVGSCW